MNISEEQLKKLSEDTMARVGDIVRAGAQVNVATRLKKLGITSADLPEGKVKEAVENEMGHLLARVVDNALQCMQSLFDVQKPEEARPRD